MKIRIRSSALQPDSLAATQRRLASGAGALLTPAALAAYALGGWRIAADLQWTGEFAIRRGLFSHWQVWIALGGAIQAVGLSLSRYGRNHDQGEGDAAA